jgi:hypothetical protein
MADRHFSLGELLDFNGVSPETAFSARSPKHVQPKGVPIDGRAHAKHLKMRAFFATPESLHSSFSCGLGFDVRLTTAAELKRTSNPPH